MYPIVLNQLLLEYHMKCQYVMGMCEFVILLSTNALMTDMVISLYSAEQILTMFNDTVPDSKQQF